MARKMPRKMARKQFGQTPLTQAVARFISASNQDSLEEMNNIFASPWEQARLSEKKRQEKQSRNQFGAFIRANSRRSVGSPEVGALTSMQFAPSAVPETPQELQQGQGGLAGIFSEFTGQGPQAVRTPTPVLPPTPMPTPVPPPMPPPMPPPTPTPDGAEILTAGPGARLGSALGGLFRRDDSKESAFNDFRGILGQINEYDGPEEEKESLRKEAITSLVDEIGDMKDRPYQQYAPLVEQLVTTDATETAVSYTRSLLESKGVNLEESRMPTIKPSPIDELLAAQEKGWTPDERHKALTSMFGWDKDDEISLFDKALSLWSGGKDMHSEAYLRDQQVALYSPLAQDIWASSEAQKRLQYDIQILNGTYTKDYGSYLRESKLWTPEEHDFQMTQLLTPQVQGMVNNQFGERVDAFNKAWADWDVAKEYINDPDWISGLVAGRAPEGEPQYREGITAAQIDYFKNAYQGILTQSSADPQMTALVSYMTSNPFRVVDWMKYQAMSGKAGTDKEFYQRSIPKRAYDWMLKNTDMSALGFTDLGERDPGTMTQLSNEDQAAIKTAAGLGLLRAYANSNFTTDFLYDGKRREDTGFSYDKYRQGPGITDK